MLPEEYDPGRKLPRHLRKQRVEEIGEISIRQAAATDMGDISNIYRHYVENTVVSFDEAAKSTDEWDEKFAYLSKLDLPFLVAVSPHGQILGFAYVSPWNSRGAYRHTVENSIYLRPAAVGLRLGPRLMTALMDECRERGIREIVAVIADRGAEASIRMHQKLGFKEVGRLGRVGYKFDHWVGTVLMQKSLKKKRKEG